MACRDALDWQGNIIGQICEPEDVMWTEEHWNELLEEYARSPLISDDDSIRDKIARGLSFAQGLFPQYDSQNIAQALLIVISPLDPDGIFDQLIVDDLIAQLQSSMG